MELLAQAHQRRPVYPTVCPDVAAGLGLDRAEVAQMWAKTADYPLPDTTNLARVSQFLAIDNYALYSKDQLCKKLKALPKPDFDDAEQPHTILASLELSTYLSAAYDDWMFQALAHHHKDPKRELFRWNRELRGSQISDLASGFKPARANPLVDHLYGHMDVPESLVLTEDDYLDYLVNIGSRQFPLPAHIQEMISGTSLM